MGRGRRGGPKRGSYKNHGSRGNKSTRGGGKFKNKRKFNNDGGQKDVTSENKRQKLQPEKESVPIIEEESSSSESEEEVKPYTQLLSMFKSSSRAQQVLTSDEEQSDEEQSDDAEESEDVNDQSNEDDIDSEQDEDSDQIDEEIEEEEGGSLDDEEVNNDEEMNEEDSIHEELEVESEEEHSGDEDEEETSSTDPFHLHFEREINETLLEILTSPKPYETQEVKWKTLGRMVVHLPTKAEKKTEHPKPTLLGETIEKYVVPCTLPVLTTGIPLREYGVKLQLCSNLDTRPLSDNDQTAEELLSPLQHELFTLANEYRDIYYPEMNHLNSDDIRTVYCLHSLNHVMKSRDKVLLHNAKLKKAKENGEATDEIEYRDQGLVRPRVLIIAPLRNSAVK